MASPKIQHPSAFSLTSPPSIDLHPSLLQDHIIPPTTTPPLSAPTFRRTRTRSRSRSRPRSRSCSRSHPASPLSLPSSPCISKPPRSPVRYNSSTLSKLNPSLAFQKRDSVRVAAAADAADVCRDRFKAERDAAADAAGEPREGDTAAEVEMRKFERRRLLNRSSASASRLRKEAYCSGLERELEELEHAFIALQVRARELEAREAERERKLKRADVVHGVCENDAGTDGRTNWREACKRIEAGLYKREGAFEAGTGNENKSLENLWPPQFEMDDSLFHDASFVPDPSGDWERNSSSDTGLDFPPFLS